MKIEIEIDEERVVQEVIEKITKQLHLEVEHDLAMSVRQIVLGTMNTRAKEIATSILKNEAPMNGVTLEEFVRGVLQRKDQKHHERTRVMQVIEDTAYRHALDEFQGQLKEYASTYKAKLVEHLVSLLMKGTE